ncbi:MAG: hypothetical protein NTW96_22255 [Planctomycetia bacterium]|nr:hypothetical protein [Planctomycetia bacterium]
MRLALLAVAMLWSVNGDAAQSCAVGPEAGEPVARNTPGDDTPAAILAEATAAARQAGPPWSAGGILCDIAGEQASAGLFTDALATARAIEYRDGKVVALQRIAGAQCRAGLLTEALATAREIDVPRVSAAEKDAADRLDPAAVSAESSQRHAAGRKAETLGMIAAAQAKAGQSDLARQTLEEALATAELIEGPARASAVCEVAVTQAEAKLADQTRQACARAMAASDPRCASDLREIAEAQARAGLFADAVATVRKIAASSPRDGGVFGEKLLAFLDIAVAQAKAGRMSEARQTFAEVLTTGRGDAEARDGICSIVSDAQVEAGFLADALATARQIKCPEGKDMALEGMAEAHIEAGLLNAALAIVRQIGGVDSSVIKSRVSLLCEIAIAQAKGGRQDEARQIFAESLSTAKQSEDVSTSGWALSEVATAQVNAGEIEQARRTIVEALAVAGKATDAESRAWVLHNIAAAQAKAGSKDNARSTFAKAFAAAREIDDAEHKEEQLSRIVNHQVEAGFFAEAIVTVRANAADGYYVPHGLREVAIGQIKAGQMEHARQTFGEAVAAARATGNPQGAMGQVAVFEAEAGLIAEALATARGLTDTREKAKALCEIGAALAKTKK